VYFDLDGDGVKVRTGWVEAVDGLLCLDLNANGRVDSGRELFGEYSGDGGKQMDGKTFPNGFLALAQYDGNMDGRINKKDEVFSKLLVWRDLDQSGTSQKRELVSISKLGVTEISLAYIMTGSFKRPQTVMDNEIRIASTFRTKDGRIHKIADVWFKQRRGSSVAEK